MPAKVYTRYILLLSLAVALVLSCSKEPADQVDYDWGLVVVGDVRQGYGILKQHASNIEKLDPPPSAAVFLGDIMLRPGNEVEWESFWHYCRPIDDRMPLYLVRGNHEGNEPEHEEIFSEQSGLPLGRYYYRKDINSISCIILDTEIIEQENSISGEQFIWLQSELSTISTDTGISHILIFMHRPVYSFGEDMGSQIDNADELHGLFLSQPKLKAVFSGHDHIYHRQDKDGLNYIITCGGGEPLYHGAGGDYYHFLLLSFKYETKSINVKTIDIFNEVIEDFDI